MAKNTCKLCSRRFASPRALAGHMRSHSMARAREEAQATLAAAAAAPKHQFSSASSASTSFAADDEEDVGVQRLASTYALRENPKRSLRAADAAFSDRDSEAESTPPHAKRVNAAAVWGGEPEPSSSLSVVSTSEDVAGTLMMLKRGSWPSTALVDDDDSDDGYAPPASPPRAASPPAPAEKRTQFQCVACKKVFRSYQALGGHRASNVRGGRGGCGAPPVAPAPPPPLPEHRDGDGDEDMGAKQPQPQPRECPHCYRVFPSGQALGAHKRSHVCGFAAPPSLAGTGTATAAASTTSAAIPRSPINMIDLNVAPPSEEMEVSDVSDSHFNPGA